jgi:hypothetical protein
MSMSIASVRVSPLRAPFSRRAAIVCGIALVTLLTAAHPSAQPTAYVRASVGSAGEQGTGPSLGGRISGDGRYVAFSSDAPNLVPGDTNALPDVFVHDRLTARTVRVSVSSAGLQVPSGTIGGSGTPEIDDTGRFVAFVSSASMLAPGDTDTPPMSSSTTATSMPMACTTSRARSTLAASPGAPTAAPARAMAPATR